VWYLLTGFRWQRAWEVHMPVVNIHIYEGFGKDRKDEVARRVTDAITGVCKLPREAVWVVFDEVAPPDW
jgi:4-oxalocrotonate tautomerase